jgi:Cysteine-rich CPXCG
LEFPGNLFGLADGCVCGRGALRMYAAGFQCAGCGEWVETTVDQSAGSKQQYVEDCQVCCQPNVLTVRWDGSAEEFTISAELES